MASAFIPNPVVSPFIASAQKCPDVPALQAKGQYYTYQSLNTICAAIVHLLDSLKLENNATIGVLCQDDIYTYASLLAVLNSGLTFVPLGLHHPKARNIQIIQDAQIKYILSAFDSTEYDFCCQNINVANRDNTVNNTGMSLIDKGVNADGRAYLLYTSGSTGKPKGVPIYYRNLKAFFDVFASHSVLNTRDCKHFLQCFQLTFDLSFFCLGLAFQNTGCCYILESEGISYLKIYEALEQFAIDVVLMTPSTIYYLRPYFDEIHLPNLKYSLFCGEALISDWVKEWEQCVPNAQIINCYGPTEATIFCSAYTWDAELSPSECRNGVVPVGKPFGANTFDLSEESELLIGGGQITTSYWNNPLQSEQKFINDNSNFYYRTGDLCQLDAQGNYLFVGRTDQQIKIDGYRIETGEIEHHLRAIIPCQLAVISVLKNGKTILIAYLEKVSFDSSLLKKELSNRVPHYMIPEKIISIEAMPYNTNGKIDRKLLASICQE